jgi:hypothetical protein
LTNDTNTIELQQRRKISNDKLIKIIAILVIIISVTVTLVFIFYNWNRTFSTLESKSTYYNDYILLDGDISIEDVDNLKIDLQVFLPNTLDSFIDDNGIIVISDNIVKQANYYLYTGIDERTRGLYLLHQNRPMIWIDSKTFDYALEAGNTVFHEMAHYLDDIYDFSNAIEFRYFYDRYAIDYDPRISVDAGYQAYDKKEYFACLFTDYTRTYKNISMSKDVYVYMSDIFERVENINKLKNR